MALAGPILGSLGALAFWVAGEARLGAPRRAGVHRLLPQSLQPAARDPARRRPGRRRPPSRALGGRPAALLALTFCQPEPDPDPRARSRRARALAPAGGTRNKPGVAGYYASSRGSGPRRGHIHRACRAARRRDEGDAHRAHVLSARTTTTGSSSRARGRTAPPCRADRRRVPRGFETVAQLAKPAVTIFGSARVGEAHPAYKEARDTGRLFAEARFTVVTGGGPGVMEAANRGAKEGGGHVVGFNIVLPHEQSSNPYLDVSLVFDHFYVAQDNVREGGGGVRDLPGRLRDPRRALRGADPDPDRQDPRLPRRPLRLRVLAGPARLDPRAAPRREDDLAGRPRAPRTSPTIRHRRSRPWWPATSAAPRRPPRLRRRTRNEKGPRLRPLPSFLRTAQPGERTRSPWSTSPRQAPVSPPRLSTRSLKRSRSPFTRRLSIAERAPERLDEALGRVLHLNGHAGLVIAERVEGHHPAFP